MKQRRVYFIRPIGMQGPIKIGCSHSPTGRRSTLETWSPFPLEILAEIEGCEKIERRFHALFTAQHQSREWFHWSPELEATIAAINAGTFNIETLPAPRRLHHGHRTGPKKGTPWTEERKAQAMVQRAVAKAEKLSGLVRDWSTVTVEQFLSDPFKYGVTLEERTRRVEARRLAFRQRSTPADPTPSQAAAA